MPISGLVVTLAQDPRQRAESLAMLRDHTAITVGELCELRLPIVVETSDVEQDREVWEWLHDLPGMMMVTVACIHFEHLGHAQDTIRQELQA